MKSTFLTSRLLALGLLALLPALTLASPQAPSKTPPTFLTILPNRVLVDDAAYQFEVTLSELKPVRGIPHIRLAVTIIRTAPTGTIRFRDIILVVPADTTTTRVQVDGRDFDIEAGYTDPYDPTENPRLVATTFGQMFIGGRAGLAIKLAS